MSKPGTERLNRALELRDRCVAFANAHGKWQGERQNRLFIADARDISISYRTPFNRRPPSSEVVRYIDALIGSGPDHPYAIEVWHRRKQVLNISWDERGSVHLSSFSPGEWELALS